MRNVLLLAGGLVLTAACAAPIDDEAGESSASAQTGTEPGHVTRALCSGGYRADATGASDEGSAEQTIDVDVAGSTVALLYVPPQKATVVSTSPTGAQVRFDATPSGVVLPLSNSSTGSVRFRVKVARSGPAGEPFSIGCLPVSEDGARPTGPSDTALCVEGNPCTIGEDKFPGACVTFARQVSYPDSGSAKVGLCKDPAARF